MYKTFMLAALMGLLGMQLQAAPATTFAEMNTAQSFAFAEDISEITLSNLFSQAALVWETHVDVLFDDYQSGKLVVKPLGEDLYELTWSRSGGAAIIAVLEDVGA